MLSRNRTQLPNVLPKEVEVVTMLIYDDVYARVQATYEAQQRLSPTWQWEEKSLADWEALLRRLRSEKAALDDTEAGVDVQMGALEAARKTLHQHTKQVLGLAKVRFRNEPAKLRAFAALQASNRSLTELRQVANDTLAAWQQTDPDAHFGTLDTNAYAALLATLNDTDKDAGGLRAARQQTRQALNKSLKVAQGDAVAWYAVATRVLPADTPDGQFLRAHIPTGR